MLAAVLSLSIRPPRGRVPAVPIEAEAGAVQAHG
jgi:hypothetical protein